MISIKTIMSKSQTQIVVAKQSWHLRSFGVSRDSAKLKTNRLSYYLFREFVLGRVE